MQYVCAKHNFVTVKNHGEAVYIINFEEIAYHQNEVLYIIIEVRDTDEFYVYFHKLQEDIKTTEEKLKEAKKKLKLTPKVMKQKYNEANYYVGHYEFELKELKFKMQNILSQNECETEQDIVNAKPYFEKKRRFEIPQLEAEEKRMEAEIQKTLTQYQETEKKADEADAEELKAERMKIRPEKEKEARQKAETDYNISEYDFNRSVDTVSKLIGEPPPNYLTKAEIDKLLNYIRFWQADGESEKTSVRTKTSLGQLVESGHFKGGVAAFGYDLIKSGRVNKRKHELYDLQVNPDEAIVVKIIFDKYTTEGYGAHRITTWLNNNGYRARTGKMWHEASIRGILCNLTYTGVLRSGEARSEVIPELQIISPEQYERAMMIMKERSDKKRENPTVPLNTKGKSLISGKVYCGHCGSRLNLTTSGRYRKRKDGTVDTTKRIRYTCYGKSRKQTECDGQSGYTLHILDDLIDEIVRGIFSKMKGVSKSDVIKLRYADELDVRKARLNMVKADYRKEFENLTILKSEVIKAIRGESSFSADTLSELISESEKECSRLFDLCTDAERDVTDGESVLKNLSDSFDELISWAELYDEASFEKKKMIVNCLIKRVEVSRGYKLKVEFNIDFEQFMVGLDKVA